ncbi:hypothetical protein BDA96_05G007300, partial [Sorghum bicolor]
IVHPTSPRSRTPSHAATPSDAALPPPQSPISIQLPSLSPSSSRHSLLAAVRRAPCAGHIPFTATPVAPSPSRHTARTIAPPTARSRSCSTHRTRRLPELLRPDAAGRATAYRTCAAAASGTTSTQMPSCLLHDMPCLPSSSTSLSRATASLAMAAANLLSGSLLPTPHSKPYPNQPPEPPKSRSPFYLFRKHQILRNFAAYHNALQGLCSIVGYRSPSWVSSSLDGVVSLSKCACTCWLRLSQTNNQVCSRWMLKWWVLL